MTCANASDATVKSVAQVRKMFLKFVPVPEGELGSSSAMGHLGMHRSGEFLMSALFWTTWLYRPEEMFNGSLGSFAIGLLA